MLKSVSKDQIKGIVCNLQVQVPLSNLFMFKIHNWLRKKFNSIQNKTRLHQFMKTKKTVIKEKNKNNKKCKILKKLQTSQARKFNRKLKNLFLHFSSTFRVINSTTFHLIQKINLTDNFQDKI